MRKKFALSFSVVGLLILFSFTCPPNFVGTYGISENDPAKIELVINDDYTFSYRDFSNPHKLIDITGDWQSKGNYIILKSTNAIYLYHNKWKIENKSATSRKGMTFYRLCKR